jgi:hypothetical protein
MFQRKSGVFFLYILMNMILLGLVFAHSSIAQRAAAPVFRAKSELVSKYELTDLCLFTDARYTRHPAMADLNTPFQDYPMSLEHFPSGSLMAPPPHLHRKNRANH